MIASELLLVIHELQRERYLRELRELAEDPDGDLPVPKWAPRLQPGQPQPRQF